MAEQLAKKTNAQSAKFTGHAFAEASEHPLQRKLTFIFTDYQPNGNKQAVPQSEAENVAKTALYMPIKINFDGEGPQGHKGAEPIGPIVTMTPNSENIVGEAIVWLDEFPEIDTYLKTASAESGGVQFSWELYYQNSEVDGSGNEWLYGITTAGIAIVDNPAYQGRTPLIAIAEGNEMDLEQLQAQVSELTNKLYSMLDALYAALALPGAVDKSTGIEEQFTKVIDSLKSMSENVAQLEADKASSDEVATEIAQLREFKATVEAVAEKQRVLASRREQLETAGITFTNDAFAERADRISTMDEDAFTFYVSELVSLQKQVTSVSAKANASKTDIAIPDPVTNTEVKQYDIKDLATALRSVKALEIK